MFLANMKKAALAAIMMTGLSLGGGVLYWQSAAAEIGPAARATQKTEKSRKPQANDIAKVVDHFVDQLMKRQVHDRIAGDKLGLYLMDVHKAGVKLIAADVDRERAYCGSPCWSSDGRRIIFDASPGQQWNKTHLQMTGNTLRTY